MYRKIFVFFLVILVVFSCRKKQPEMNTLKKECGCIKEISADFKIGEMFRDSLIELDTIHIYKDYNSILENSFGNCYVKFSAKIENAISYEWQVGNNSTSQTTKEFGLYFNTEEEIPVRLIVHSIPNKICFPNDDGIDTITKILIIKSFEKPPLTGKYKGYNINSPNDEFIIEIDTFRNPDFPLYIRYGIKNLPIGNYFDEIGEVNTMSFNGYGEGSGPDGGNVQFIPPAFNGFFDKKTNQITIKYSARYYSDSYEILKTLMNQTFIGKKL